MNKLKYLKKLKRELPYGKASKIITKNRLKDVFEKCDIYIEEPSVFNLHRLRISVRRLRFVFELFGNCYPKEKFRYTLKYLKQLQDIIGSARDLDVMKDKIEKIARSEGIRVPRKLLSAVSKNNTVLKGKISKELLKFKGDKIIQSLLK